MRSIFTLILLFPLMAISQQVKEPADPKDTEVWEPIPPKISFDSNNIPSDAIILLGVDGKLNKWQSTDRNIAKWKQNKDGSITVKKGTSDIQTKQNFGSIQLHLEWQAPKKIIEKGQGRGNSGVFLQNRYEIQILDNYNNRTYSNGQAGALYKQQPPLVNACKEPNLWQVYDMIFHTPQFGKLGQLIQHGYITVLHNGVLVQDHTQIIGSTEYIGWPKNIPHGKSPIRLQNHGNPVSYRNIWVREL